MDMFLSEFGTFHGHSVSLGVKSGIVVLEENISNAREPAELGSIGGLNHRPDVCRLVFGRFLKIGITPKVIIR